MQGRKTPIKIIFSEEERKKLDGLMKSYKTSVGLMQRLKIILMISEGNSLTEIGRILGVQRRIVRKWGRRFVEKRFEGLKDAPRSGHPRVFSPGSSNPYSKNGL